MDPGLRRGDDGRTDAPARERPNPSSPEGGDPPLQYRVGGNMDSGLRRGDDERTVAPTRERPQLVVPAKAGTHLAAARTLRKPPVIAPYRHARAWPWHPRVEAR